MKKLEGKRQEINRRFNEISEMRCKAVHQITVDLAEEYGVSWTTIRNEIEKENLKNAKNRLTKSQELVYNELKKGKSQSEVAKELSVTRQNIGIILKQIRKKGHEIEITEGKRGRAPNKIE